MDKVVLLIEENAKGEIVIKRINHGNYPSMPFVSLENINIYICKEVVIEPKTTTILPRKGKRKEVYSMINRICDDAGIIVVEPVK